MTQTDQAYVRLREAIINLELEPGQMYSEVDLANFVGLGRTPAREAVQRLAREELVESRKNRGIMITSIDPIKQLELLDVRRSLEHLLARRSCEKATPDERRLMLQYADEIEQAAADSDVRGFLASNRDIQDLKAKAAHNDTLRATMDLFFGLSRRYWVANYQKLPESLAHAATLHASILRSIATSDVNAAVSSSDGLIDFLEDFTRRTVRMGQPGH
jgi:DNA-binding GntR family transcriptional regulator